MLLSLEMEDSPVYVKRSSNNPLLLSLLQRKDSVYRSPCWAVPLQKSSLKVEMRRMMMAQRQTECHLLLFTSILYLLTQTWLVIFSVKQCRGPEKYLFIFRLHSPFQMFLNKFLKNKTWFHLSRLLAYFTPGVKTTCTPQECSSSTCSLCWGRREL